MYYDGIVILQLKKLPIQQIKNSKKNNKFISNVLNLYSCFCKEKSSLSKLNDKINFLEIKKSKFSNNIVLSLKKQDNSFSNFLLLIKLISTHYFFIEKSKQSDLCIIILLSNRFLIKILVKELILLVL